MRIVKMPLLMADRMAFAEGRDEQVPGFFADQRFEQFSLRRDAFDHAPGERLVFGWRSIAPPSLDEVVDGEVAFAPRLDAERGVQTESPGDLACPLRRRAMQSIMAIVAPPFVQLEAIYLLGRAGVRHIDDDDPPSGIADSIPE